MTSGKSDCLRVFNPMAFLKSVSCADLTWLAMQSIGANAVVGGPQAYLTCPNDQYGQSKTCDDFGDKMALSANGKILILTGGFKQVHKDARSLMQQAVYNSFVYQTTGCVSDRGSQGA